MAKSPKDRLHLKLAILERLKSHENLWTTDSINLLLREFELEPFSSAGTDSDFYRCMEPLNDDDLDEFHAAVCDDDLLRPRVEHYDPSVWSPGAFRLFLSHSAAHTAFADEVAEQLGRLGIAPFVAHRSARVDEDWQKEIEGALTSMHAFVVLTHNEIPTSSWCQQEIGWALGSRTPTYAVRMPGEPGGFLTRRQWPVSDPEDAAQVTEFIYAWLRGRSDLRDAVSTAAIAAFASASSYVEANHISKQIVGFAELPEAQWTKLDAVISSNKQVRDAWVTTDRLEIYYREHARAWPLHEHTDA